MADQLAVPPDSFDEREWQKVLSTAAANIDEADQRFRSTRAGEDPAKVMAAFHVCGPLVDLSASSLRRYAGAVSAGAPFDLLALGDE